MGLPRDRDHITALPALHLLEGNKWRLYFSPKARSLQIIGDALKEEKRRQERRAARRGLWTRVLGAWQRIKTKLTRESALEKAEKQLQASTGWK
jgi:hypothetical protein